MWPTSIRGHEQMCVKAVNSPVQKRNHLSIYSVADMALRLLCRFFSLLACMFCSFFFAEASGKCIHFKSDTNGKPVYNVLKLMQLVLQQ